MKYYIIAGERSGDLHGSNLIKAIKEQDSEAVIRAWGGDMMQEAGADLVKHYRDIAFMGLGEVIKNLPTILGLLSFCKKDILTFKPDAVILIDYAGFNMKIAKFAKKNVIKTFYYISPKVWAWNQSRAWNIKKYVDRLFVIFPFEKAFSRNTTTKWTTWAILFLMPLQILRLKKISAKKLVLGKNLLLPFCQGAAYKK